MVCFKGRSAVEGTESGQYTPLCSPSLVTPLCGIASVCLFPPILESPTPADRFLLKVVLISSHRRSPQVHKV